MSKKYFLLIGIFIWISISCFAQYPAGSPVAINGKLKVTGRYLTNECGNPVQLRGMSTHGVQWFSNCINGSSLQALATDWSMDVLRIAMYIEEGGYVTNPSYWRTWIDNIVDECGKKGVYVIIDFHVHRPGDPMYYIDNAKSFWTYMSTKHKGKKHVLYEICNEPSYVTWSRVKEYANQIIPIIRANDPQTIILVGTTQWSKDVDSASYDPLPYSNLMYSLHYYTQGEYVRVKASIATGRGLPIFVTEFGTSNASNTEGPFLDEMEIWNAFLADNKVSWVNWTFSDKDEPSSALLSGSCNGNWNNTSASGTWIKNKMLNPADNFVCDGQVQIVKNPSLPFSGNPINIPGKLEAENYDLGSNGIAYRDFTAGNSINKNIFRKNDVDIIACSDTGSGFSISEVQAGEWLNYSVNVASLGNYDINLRLASSGQSNLIRVEINGKNISDLISVPFTGSASKWKTVKIPNVPLTAGIQDLKVHFIQSGTYLNYIRIAPSANNPINNPPDVYISSQINNLSFNPQSNITLTAAAFDTDGSISKVEFYSGTKLLGEALTKPYSFIWKGPQSGDHSITAKAIDNLGGFAISSPINVIIKNTSPIVKITNPNNGAAYKLNNAINLKADAIDNGGSIKKVEFFNNGIKIGELATSPYSLPIILNPAGTYNFTVLATDNSGLSTLSSVTSITVSDPLTGISPSVSITSPITGTSLLTPAQITITANASDPDGTVSKVIFYSGENILATDSIAPYSFVWNNVLSGTYALKAKAIDNKNNSTVSAIVNVVVFEPRPPVISISSPQNGTVIVSQGTIVIQPSIQIVDYPISKVEFYANSIKIGESISSPYTFNWTNIASGNYSIYSKAIDTKGLASLSNTLTISALNCPAENVPLASNWTIRNDWTDQNNGSSVSNADQALLITHRQWGQNRLFLVENTFNRAVQSGKTYLLNFEVKNDPTNPINQLEIGFASGVNYNTPITTQPTSSYAIGSGTDYLKKSYSIVSATTGNISLVFGLKWPNQPNLTAKTYLRNLSFCVSGTNARTEEIENETVINEPLSQLLIAPNPSQSNFTILSETKNKSVINLTVTGITGNIIYSADSFTNETISIGQDWPSGIYTLRINDGQTVKVLKLEKY